MSSNIATITCDPPLGSITTVGTSSILINVFINASSHSGPDLDVRIWHQSKEGWKDLCLPQIPVGDDDTSGQLSRFQGTLENREELPRRVDFTLKIIAGEQTHWVKDIQGLSDGIIIFQDKFLLPSLDDYLRSVETSWKIEQTRSKISPDSKVWIFCSTIKASKAKVSLWNTLRLGCPVNSLKWFALVRHSTPWIGPRQGDSKFQADKPGVVASFLRQDGSHLVILPVNGIDGVLTTLESDDVGNVIVRSQNDSGNSRDASVIITVGKRFEQALEIAISQLRSLLQSQNDQKRHGKTSLRRDIIQFITSKSNSESSLPKLRASKPQPDLSSWHDGLSYCTWNSLGRSLSSSSILSALSTLSAHGLKPTNLIIDDNWQSLDTGPATNIYNDTNKYRWTDFEANSENFPNGLAHLIKTIREAHPHIRHIAVWHGLFGYWGGISPSGTIAKRYKTIEVTRKTEEYYLHGGTITVVAPSDAARLYDDFYAFLASCGVDAVKTDTQFYPDYIAHAPDRAALIYSYQDAWLGAVEKHFAHRGIACMAQTPQILFHSFLSRSNDVDTPAYMLRNSDDFIPEKKNQNEGESDAVQAWHLFSNAHNAVLTQHLNVLPDWDMFQTTGAWARMHAAARCLSGGPVYVTDVPGTHDLDLLKQITAVGRSGALRVLKLEGKGRAVEVYERKESRRFLRVGNRHAGVRLLGLFNLGEEEELEVVTARCFDGLDGGEILLRRYVRERVDVLDGFKGVVAVALKRREFEILTAYPITERAGVRFVVLGLLGKMTGVAALSGQPEVAVAEDVSLCVRVSLKALGMLGLCLENASEYLARDLVSAVLVSEKEKIQLKVENQGEDGASGRPFKVEIRIRSLAE